MKLASLVAIAGTAAALLAVDVACEDGTPATPCVNIPPAGCPEQGGVDVCTDPTCDSAYACQNGKWVFDRKCPPREGGAPEGGTPVRDGGARDAIVVDAPPGAYGGPGCVDLQPPDCALGVALSCGGQSDCCGCQDLFVCANGGWNLWGECVDGGPVQK